MGKPQLDTVVDRIVRQLRIGAHPSSFLRQVLGRLHGYTDREIDRALQKARRDGVIEYSKGPGTSRKMWRMVERNPARKVGASMAVRILESAVNRAHEVGTREMLDELYPGPDALESGAWADGSPHAQVKSELDVAHDQGFADGQMHAFQTVADQLRTIAKKQPMIAGQALMWADEIESGAWAEEEASDESP